jgi:HSP20 family protein
MILVRRSSDLDTPFHLFDNLQNELDALMNTHTVVPAYANATPRIAESESSIVVTLDVPGLTEKDVQVQYHEGVVTLSGERKIQAPEGFKPVRIERQSFKFTRSFVLSSQVDIEHSTASVHDGILTLTLPKTKESKPRAIEVRSAN